jgi:hypothetical protein
MAIEAFVAASRVPPVPREQNGVLATYKGLNEPHGAAATIRLC